MSSAGTLRAEYLPALLARTIGTARQSCDRPQLEGCLRELWRHLLLHATLESLALLRAEERALLLDVLVRADKGDAPLVTLLESGRVRTGSVVGFFGALRRTGTPAAEVLKLLSELFNNAGSEQIARMFVSPRSYETDELTSVLNRVDAHTQAIGFDTWGVELGTPFPLFSQSPRLGLGYLKRLDILRLAHAVRELVSGNFQLLFERVQTVEIMAFHFSQLQRRLGEYKRDKTERSLDQLEQTIAQLLDVPVVPSLYKYSTMVNEIAARLGKRASLQIHGDTTTALPREHLYPLHDALVHLLRNGIDHGLETPEERVQAGKPERGTIEIECLRTGDQVKIVLRDDGRGIDPAQVKAKALELKLISAQAAEQLSNEQVIDLVFLPHFSTARSVTDISGRGIGMDVVRESLVRIGAQMTVDSRVGIGTTFTIFLGRGPSLN
jgi:chemotaxis protein histidine kinase CheA